jgi:hypothetical protein
MDFKLYSTPLGCMQSSNYLPFGSHGHGRRRPSPRHPSCSASPACHGFRAPTTGHGAARYPLENFFPGSARLSNALYYQHSVCSIQVPTDASLQNKPDVAHVHWWAPKKMWCNMCIYRYIETTTASLLFYSVDIIFISDIAFVSCQLMPPTNVSLEHMWNLVRGSMFKSHSPWSLKFWC